MRIPLFIRSVFVFVGLTAAGAISVHAGDLFTIHAVTTDTSGITVTSGNHSVIDLSQELINNTGAFSALNGHGYNALLNYGGVPNALAFRVTQGTLYTATLTSPFDPGVINRRFVAASQEELYADIKNYLKTDGSSDLSRFLADINKKSPVGVLDGNPNSATALSAQQSFMQYGFEPTMTEEESDAGGVGSGGGRVGLALMADGGQFSSKGIKGDTWSIDPMLPIKLTDRVRLELSVPLEYTRIEDATEYGVGLQLATPILIIKHTKKQPWTWQLTPVGGAMGSGSADLLAGGLMWDVGLASYTCYRWNKWEFSMGNAVTAYRGIKVQLGGYTFDPDVSQEIIKNGLKVGRQLGRRWYVEAYAIDTEFTEDAFIPRYTTVGGGVGYRGIKKKGYVMIGGYTDLAPGYTSAKFQFGTGWKF